MAESGRDCEEEVLSGASLGRTSHFRHYVGRPVTFMDLVLFSGSVYGLSWLVTKSKITESLRMRLEDVPFLGDLFSCVVCMSVWIALFVLFFARGSILVPQVGFPGDVVVLVGWSTFTTWVLARLLGDAD